MIILPTLTPTQIRSLGGNEQYGFGYELEISECAPHKKVPGWGRALLFNIRT